MPPPVVTGLTDDGIAALSGQLQLGVTLIAVNGQAVLGHEQGTELLKMATGVITLTIQQPQTIAEVTIAKRTASADVGFTLSSDEGGGATTIASLSRGFATGKALEVGAELISVDGEDVVNQAQASELLLAAKGSM